MTDAWEMHQAETGLNPGPVWRDRGIIIATLTERNQALEERVAELEGSCQKLRDDYQGALAETKALRASIEALLKSPTLQSCGGLDIGDDGCFLGDLVRPLRAALASPAEDTTPTEQQAQSEDYPDAEGLAVLRDNEAKGRRDAMSECICPYDLCYDNRFDRKCLVCRALDVEADCASTDKPPTLAADPSWDTP